MPPVFRAAAAVVIPSLLAAAHPAPQDGGGIVETQHVATIAGQRLHYRAQAGRLATADANGTPLADMFFAAYRLPTTGRPRPVTFFFSGGPGANTSWEHLTVFGPKMLSDTGVVDNPDTLLRTSDLVFVDAPDTGYSRTRDGSVAAGVYSTVGDQALNARFVRDWLARYATPDTPVILFGLSFGVPRSNGVAEQLAKAGVMVRGTVLMSGGRIAVNTRVPQPINDALFAPPQAMAAYHHGKLAGASPDAVRRRTEAWARATYAPLLARVASLTPAEREAAAADIAAHIGVPASTIDRKTLYMVPSAFNAALAPPRRLTLYDRREFQQPTDKAALAARSARVGGYIAGQLGYRSDLPYWYLGDPDQAQVNEQWRYTGDASAIAWAIGGGGPPESVPWISHTLRLNPTMKVFVSVGYYDSQNSCEANEELRRRLPARERRAFTLRCYVGGHSVQRDVGSIGRVNRDIAAFIAAAAR